MEVLREAHAAGRLKLDEFLDRSGTAYAARSWRELRKLTGDLPEGKPLPSPEPEHGSYYEVIELRYPSRRRSALVWAAAVAALAIASAAPSLIAVPLVVLSVCALCANSLFILCATRAGEPLVRKFVAPEMITSRSAQDGPRGDHRRPGGRRCKHGAGPAVPRCGR